MLVLLSVSGSDILIDAARRAAKAVEFLETAVQQGKAEISVVSRMELGVGCRNRRGFVFIDGLDLADY